MVSRSRFVNRILGPCMEARRNRGVCEEGLDRKDEELGQCSDIGKVLSRPGKDISEEESREMVACALCGLGKEAQEFS
jgi:hypothetical protein